VYDSYISAGLRTTSGTGRDGYDLHFMNSGGSSRIFRKRNTWTIFSI